MIDTETEIFKRLDALAEKIGQTAEYAWPQLVEYTAIEAQGSLVLGLCGVGVGLLVVLLGVFFAYLGTKKDESFFIGTFFGCVIGAILLCSIGSGLPAVYAKAKNPEGYLINKVITGRR